jgi:hypothetical protein
VATALDIIDRSLRLLGQIGSGETASSDEAADGLEAVNALAESWRNERLMCFAMQEESLTLSDGTASYTIGTSGTLNTTRPVAIEEAWIVDNNVSYPVRLITEEEYAAISDKTTESDWPEVALYRPSIASSQATLIVWPLPNATRTMKLLTRVVFSGFALTSTTVLLPPGWERALAYNLAAEWAPEFQVSPSAEVVQMARESKGNIKRTNHRPIKSFTDLGMMFGAQSGNILSGP